MGRCPVTLPSLQAPSRTLRRLAVSLATICCLVVLVEAAFRLGLPEVKYLHRMPFHRVYGFRPFPGPYAFHRVVDGELLVELYNDRGDRGPEFDEKSLARVPNEERLLFIGDSFVQAWGVADDSHFGSRVEDHYRERGRTARAFYLSCNSYGTTQQWLMYQQHGEEIDPDRVILVMFLPNDVLNNSIELAGQCNSSIGDYLRPYGRIDADGDLAYTYRHPVRAFFRRHSRVFRGFEVDAYHARKVFAYAPDDLEAQLSVSERMAQGYLPRKRFEFFEHEPSPIWSRASKLTEELVRGFAREVRADGREFDVVLIPSVMQVEYSASYYDFERKLAELGQPTLASRFDEYRPERWMTSFLDTEGIDHTATLLPLREATQEKGVSTYRHCGHLNAFGHQVVGDTVARLLLDDESRTVDESPQGNPPMVDLASASQALSHWDFGQCAYEELFIGVVEANTLIPPEVPEATNVWQLDHDYMHVWINPRTSAFLVQGVTRYGSGESGSLSLGGASARLHGTGPFLALFPPSDDQGDVLEVGREFEGVVTLGRLARLDPIYLLTDDDQAFKAVRELSGLSTEERSRSLAARAEARATDRDLTSLWSERMFIDAAWVVNLRERTRGVAGASLVATFSEARASLTEEALRQLREPAFAVTADSAPFVARWLLVLEDGELLTRFLESDAVSALAPALRARLEDRSAQLAGRPQPFGTVAFPVAEGYWEYPVLEPEELEERRRAAGLEPLARERAARKLRYESVR